MVQIMQLSGAICDKFALNVVLTLLTFCIEKKNSLIFIL